jgi:hypothetical protein
MAAWAAKPFISPDPNYSRSIENAASVLLMLLRTAPD